MQVADARGLQLGSVLHGAVGLGAGLELGLRVADRLVAAVALRKLAPHEGKATALAVFGAEDDVSRAARNIERLVAANDAGSLDALDAAIAAAAPHTRRRRATLDDAGTR